MEDPIKEKLIQIVLGMKVPEKLAAERDKLVETLRRKDVVISNFNIRDNANEQDVEKEMDEFLQHTLEYFHQESLELAPTPETHKPSRKT